MITKLWDGNKHFMNAKIICYQKGNKFLKDTSLGSYKENNDLGLLESFKINW